MPFLTGPLQLYAAQHKINNNYEPISQKGIDKCTFPSTSFSYNSYYYHPIFDLLEKEFNLLIVDNQTLTMVYRTFINCFQSIVT